MAVSLNNTIFLREKDNEIDERMSDFVFGGYVMLDKFRLG
jgi:hypothetical protein